jgi:phosphohistidine phosphatase SixA
MSRLLLLDRPSAEAHRTATPTQPDKPVHRRQWLASLGAGLAAPLLASVQGPAWAQPATTGSLADLVRVWQREKGVLLMRHADTEAGLGDPPDFVLGQCHTQRNLSEAGRQASLALGQWLRAHQIQVDGVRSSQWCRCQDTARLAFGQFEDWPALNSTFAGQGDPAAQQRALFARLQAMSGARMEVWVTHQVIMTRLTGAYPGMGEGFVVDRQGRLLARGDLAA